MLLKPKRHLEVLSISALDLFASALGVFVLIAILLFPYYLKSPSQESDIEGASAELTALGEAYEEAKRAAAAAAAAAARAEARLRRAEAALADAEATAAEAGSSVDLAQRQADAAAEKKADVRARPDANFAMRDLDLVFVMDATGSMEEEIRDVQANLLGLMRVLGRLAPSLNVGFVAYKDRGDEFLVRKFPLVPMRGGNLNQISAFVRGLKASGGGDFPEPVALALGHGVDMNWRAAAEGRIVVVGDAPSHREDWAKAFGSAAQFAASAPDKTYKRRVSTIFTGERGVGRQFFERLAEAGGGDFVQHRGRMMESVLLSVLDESVTWKRGT